MDTYEFRPKDGGFELSGGRLEAPLHFPEKDAREYALWLRSLAYRPVETAPLHALAVWVETKAY